MAGLDAVAQVAIVAEERLSGHAAHRRLARLGPVAHVTIVALQRLAVRAACRRVAGLDAVAWIAVITSRGRTGRAHAGGADIARGARVAVVTGGLFQRRVGRIDAGAVTAAHRALGRLARPGRGAAARGRRSGVLPDDRVRVRVPATHAADRNAHPDQRRL